MFEVAVVGATGYAGGEVLRLLTAHPGVRVRTVTAGASAGSTLGEHHPHLHSLAHLVVSPSTVENLLGHDVVFFALPHGASGELTAQLEAAGFDGVAIDCGADHRLTSAAAWEQWYGGTYPGAWTYGMPELLHAGEATAKEQRAALRATKRVAVPGCNVTAITLAFQPLLDLIDPAALTAVLAVGYSGAGKALKPHLTAAEALGQLAPYAVGGAHRHVPEIEQNLAVAGAKRPRISFTPVLAPVSRGILATCTAPTTASTEQLHAAASAAYASEELITVLPPGQWPSTAPVVGTGRAVIGVGLDERAGRAVAICAIDNLGKGTASAGIQCMNLTTGQSESTGVPLIGVAP
ncbi:N-acetyl-gamma-glutamyl-phosphate reductase [Buchananella felis]|uniref:N-acetyl-gamma-glutamyl-phosphate reductase n=1 Tax=Buchananella felis TaxID=3231492 RepID=UPI003528AF68